MQLCNNHKNYPTYEYGELSPEKEKSKNSAGIEVSRIGGG